jgi:hypothetical protein
MTALRLAAPKLRAKAGSSPIQARHSLNPAHVGSFFVEIDDLAGEQSPAFEMPLNSTGVPIASRGLDALEVELEFRDDAEETAPDVDRLEQSHLEPGKHLSLFIDPEAAGGLVDVFVLKTVHRKVITRV